MKIKCRKCGKRKDLDKFYIDKHNVTTGHESTCIVCKRKHMKERMREARRIKKEAEK
jgi:hypothetical protein